MNPSTSNANVNFYYLMKCSYVTSSSFSTYLDVTRDLLLVVRQINDTEMFEKLTSLSRILGLILVMVNNTETLFYNYDECINMLPESILWYCQSVSFSYRWANIWSLLCKHFREKGSRSENETRFNINSGSDTEAAINIQPICNQQTTTASYQRVSGSSTNITGFHV